MRKCLGRCGFQFHRTVGTPNVVPLFFRIIDPYGDRFGFGFLSGRLSGKSHSYTSFTHAIVVPLSEVSIE